MKNSVWYSKLWQKKMEELPLPEDPNTAWSAMQSLLDKDPLLNVPSKGSPVAKTIGSKLVSLLAYILPAAAMISTVAYLAVKEPKHHAVPAKSILRKDLPAKTRAALPQVLENILQDSADSPRPVLTQTSTGNVPLLVEPLKTNSVFTDIRSDAILPGSLLEGVSAAEVLTASSSPNESSLISANIPPSNRYPGLKFSFIDVQHPENKKLKDLKVKEEKSKKIRTHKPKRQQQPLITPPFNFGINAGLSTYSTGKNVFLGVSATYALSKRLLLNGGITLNVARKIKGEYEHPSYSSDPSAQPFRIVDDRKFNTIDIPVTLEYRISNRISIKAGPIFSFPSKQQGNGSKVEVKSLLDTLYHKKQITAALGNTTINKVNLGFSGGVTVRIGQFNIEANYQQNSKPYKISSDLGSYEYHLKSFQIGLGYRFK